MQQQIMPFQFETFSLRVELNESGEPVFHAGDLCAMLGYSNPWDAVKRHVDEMDLVKREALTEGGRQMVNWVREPGMWSLILGSHAPNAKPIKRWVTAEVLPAIRKTGEYRINDKRHTHAMDLSLSQLIEGQRHMMAIIDQLKHETTPTLRTTLHANLEAVCRTLDVPVPPLDQIGQEYKPIPVHPLVPEFWTLYHAIGASVLNHSVDPRLIAINLPHLRRLAVDQGYQPLPLGSSLYQALVTSANPKFLTIKPVHSALSAQHNRAALPIQRKPKTVKCWVFEAHPRASPS